METGFVVYILEYVLMTGHAQVRLVALVELIMTFFTFLLVLGMPLYYFARAEQGFNGKGMSCLGQYEDCSKNRNLQQ